MTLKEVIESGKPFKHKRDHWAYTEPQPYMLKAISNDWEVVEVTEEQKQLDAEFSKGNGRSF